MAKYIGLLFQANVAGYVAFFSINTVINLLTCSMTYVVCGKKNTACPVFPAELD